MYLEPTAAYDVAVKLSSSSAERLTMKEDTLRQRLKERGLLVSHEEGRLTTRETLEGARRRVLHLKAEHLIEVVHANGDSLWPKQAACAA